MSGKPDNTDEIKNAFSIFDKDGSGMLRIAEVKHVMSRIGDPINEDDLDKFVEILDRQGDGFIRIEDLVDLLAPQTDRGSLLAKTTD